ncbi:MAG: hypothetical protein ACREUL_09185 [Steroidobacteraceae bacterium]
MAKFGSFVRVQQSAAGRLMVQEIDAMAARQVDLASETPLYARGKGKVAVKRPYRHGVPWSAGICKCP